VIAKKDKVKLWEKLIFNQIGVFLAMNYYFNVDLYDDWFLN
jgi:hypothetical protein